MGEHSNMFDVQHEILNNLNNYIKKNVDYEVFVNTKKVREDMPTIIFEMPRNELQSRSTNYVNTTRLINFNINIYCYRKSNCKRIVEELAVLVCDVMEEYYHMKGGLIAILPILDNQQSSYQANLRFTASYIPSQLKIY